MADIIRIIITIFIPPLGVFLIVGLGLQFWINHLLPLLGNVPAHVNGIRVMIRANREDDGF